MIYFQTLGITIVIPETYLHLTNKPITSYLYATRKSSPSFPKTKNLKILTNFEVSEMLKCNLISANYVEL
jgi:hypothetical protein